MKQAFALDLASVERLESIYGSKFDELSLMEFYGHRTMVPWFFGSLVRLSKYRRKMHPFSVANLN